MNERPGCREVGAGCIIFKSIANQLLKLKKDFLPNGFGRGKNEGIATIIRRIEIHASFGEVS